LDILFINKNHDFPTPLGREELAP